MASEELELLSERVFRDIVTHAPLISVDLLLKNKENRFLLGRRRNRPAKDSYFFPGGRIRKNETVKGAISRILVEEIGVKVSNPEPVFIGFFEHLYEDGVFVKNGSYLPTHYVSLSFLIGFDDEIDEVVFGKQHSKVAWLSKIEAISEEDVHDNCKECLMAVDLD